MSRFWVIAPYHADRPDVWKKVWRYDIEHAVISIGSHAVGDVSSLAEDELLELIARTYPEWGFRVLGGKLGLRPSSQDFRRHGSDVQRAE